jgi:hypothetical protein
VKEFRQMPRQRVLIIAEKFDERARKLAAGLGDRALVVAPADLSRPGWTFHPDPRRRTGCNGSEAFSAGDLSAVIIRLVAVFPGQILHVVAKDREYVAVEMTAFLRAWLYGLSCPLINPPTASSLSGPVWESERWAMLAHRLKIPFVSTRLRVPANQDRLPELNPQPRQRVVVVGEEVIASQECPGELANWARTLVSAAGIYCGAVHFDISDSGARALSVDCWPDLSEAALFEALRRALGDQARTVESDPAANCYVRESVSILSARCAS